jgi:hypothetical protein
LIEIKEHENTEEKESTDKKRILDHVFYPMLATSIYLWTFRKNGTPKPRKFRQVMDSPAVSVEFHTNKKGGGVITRKILYVYTLIEPNKEASSSWFNKKNLV